MAFCHNYRRVYRQTYTRRYFIKSCTKIMAFCHNYRRVYRQIYTRRYFTESCKTITAFCHHYRWVYRQTCHNYRCISRRIHRWMVHNPKRMLVRSYWRICRRTRQNQCVRVLAHNFWRICWQTSKNMEGFLKFLVRESIKYRWNYWWNLMPPPKKILLYVPSAMPSEILCYKPPLSWFILPPLLISSPLLLSMCIKFLQEFLLLCW